MAIPCLEMLIERNNIETISVDGKIAYQLKRNKNYYITKDGALYSIFVKGAHGKTDINNPRKVSYGMDKDGYYRVVLSDEGNHDRIKIHQIMVEQFIGEVKDGYVINHIDGNKHNNNYLNLEVITNIENIHHAWRTGLISKESNPNRIHIDAIDNETGETIHFMSKHDLMKAIGCSWKYIDRALNYDYYYMFCYFKHIDTGMSKKEYYIEVYFNGKLLRTFKDNDEAGKFFGKASNTISKRVSSESNKKYNRYTLTFPNLSTIESAV